MDERCVIADFQINEKAARMNAFLVIIGVIFFIYTPAKWMLFILGMDFFIRGFISPRFSPFSMLSKFIIDILKIQPLLINAGPKIFASQIGFAICVSILLFYILDLKTAGNIFALSLVLCASLEAFLGYCVGCKIFSLLNK